MSPWLKRRCQNIWARRLHQKAKASAEHEPAPYS